jgi:hypothetical protein
MAFPRDSKVDFKNRLVTSDRLTSWTARHDEDGLGLLIVYENSQGLSLRAGEWSLWRAGYWECWLGPSKSGFICWVGGWLCTKQEASTCPLRTRILNRWMCCRAVGRCAVGVMLHSQPTTNSCRVQRGDPRDHVCVKQRNCISIPLLSAISSLRFRVLSSSVMTPRLRVRVLQAPWRALFGIL